MHLPPAFVETDPARIRALIRDHPFGLLVTHGPRGVEASHIPFVLDDNEHEIVLHGHLGAANPQCDALGRAGALAVFSGPHAYVSPSWYVVQPAVPTWDYVAVHVHGRLDPVHDPIDMATALQRFADADPAGFQVDAMPPLFRDRMMAGIRSFRLVADRVEAVWKMSQNRAAKDRHGVIAALRALGDPASLDVAALVEATLPEGEE